MKNNCTQYGKSIFGFFIALMLISSAAAQDLEDIVFLQGAYENPAYKTNPSETPSIRSDTCTIFSGNVDSLNTAPNDGTNFLMQSSVGWPSPAAVGWVNPNTAGQPANAAEQLLQDGYDHLKALERIYLSYYQNADDPSNPESIYLAFDFITSNGDNRVLMGAGDLFDDELAEYAKSALFIAYNINPYLTYIEADGTELSFCDLLFDIPYYESVSLLMKGNLALEKAFSVRFLTELKPPGYVINAELEKLGWNTATDSFDETYEEGAWKHFNEASKVWIDLFTSPIQRDFLKTCAPYRSLDSKNNEAFKDTERPHGFPPDEEWPPVVYEGYKDVAAMIRALAQRARVVHEVARRLVLKLQRNDASALIENYVQQMAVEEAVIMNFFFPQGLPQDHVTKYPGLAESFLTLRDAASQLSQLRDAATNRRLNSLGFDKDVLFIRSVEPGSSEGILYTYNWLESQLYDGGGNPINVLKNSHDDDQNAEDTRKAFELKAAQYLTEFDRIEDEYDTQLIALCGHDPNDEFKPNLADPLSGNGLLAQQDANVEIAINQIERITRQMQNVHSWIENERNRVSQLGIVSDNRIELINSTGDRVALLTEQIAGIQAEMSIANGIAQGVAAASTANFSHIWGGGGVAAAAHIANGFFQADQQRRIGNKQASISKLQTEQHAQFEYLSKEAESINSATQIKNRYLELRTLEIDMFDAELRYGQELMRLSQYYTEIENKVMRRDRALNRQARRSLADPTYRIEVTNAALKAEDSLQIAQKWIYFLAKALDYKWPTGQFKTEYIFQDILMARTASELESSVDDMRSINMTQQGNPGSQYYYWNYSLRKEYLGMTFDKEIPNSGDARTPVEQFQDYLTELIDDSKNIVQVDNTPYLAIPFSTVKFDIYDDNYNLEQTEDSEGNPVSALATPIFQAGMWDSKIDWVRVNIIGNNIYTHDPEKMAVYLWYGGSGFVRTRDNFTDQTSGKELDFLVYQNPAYTFRPSRRGFGWQVLPYIKQLMTAKLVTQPRDIPEYVFTSKAFRERPVAATDWRILFPLNGTNFNNIRDIEIIILYTARTRQ